MKLIQLSPACQLFKNLFIFSKLMLIVLKLDTIISYIKIISCLFKNFLLIGGKLCCVAALTGILHNFTYILSSGPPSPPPIPSL